MSLSKKLHKIRQKPDHVKERILVGCMTIGVVVVVGVWISTFNPNNLKLQDSSNFIKNTKDYFTNSQGNVFDAQKSQEVFENANPRPATGTQSGLSTSTSLYIPTSTDTNSY